MNKKKIQTKLVENIILTKSTNLVAKPKTARKTAPKLHVSNKVNEFFFLPSTYPYHRIWLCFIYKKNHIFTHQPKMRFCCFSKTFHETKSTRS